MSKKYLILLMILIPSLVSADSSFFSWITNLKVVPELRSKQKTIKEIKREAVEVIATSTPIATSTIAFSTTTTPTTFAPQNSQGQATTTTFSQIKSKLISTSKNLTQDSNYDGLIAQISKLKAENVALRKTVSGLQEKVATLTNENNSYIKNIETIKIQSTPKALARVKELEWLIKGILDNNYRNKIDADGNKQAEMVVNTGFFRSLSANELKDLIKEYDSLTNSTLALRFKEFTNTPPPADQKKFEEFYYHFLSIRKYPK